MLFGKKYSPSIKTNNQLKEKVVGEIKNFIHRLEHGKYVSDADRERVLDLLADLKESVELLDNTVGTGKEDIGALADKILSQVKDLRKTSDQDILQPERVRKIATDLDFNIRNWTMALEGDTYVLDDEDLEVQKTSYARRRLEERLTELVGIKESFAANIKRLNKEIQGYEADLAELKKLMISEENERRINEIFRKIKALESNIEMLNVHSNKYSACFNLLEQIYVNAREMVQATEYASDDLGKAKALLDIGKLKKVLTDPEKAMQILNRMKADIKAISEKTEKMDTRISEMDTATSKISDAAMAYKAELMRKEREKAGHAEVDAEIATSTIIKEKTTAEEDN